MKKLNHLYTAILAVSLILFTSCDKYLDVTPKGQQILTTDRDYDQWLNTNKLEGCEPMELNYLADTFDWPIGQSTSFNLPPSYSSPKVYLWYNQFDPDLLATPVIWSAHYKNIYLFNTVIQHIDAATGDAQKKASLKAEALLGRAFEYLYLVNEYGKPYNAQTASTDLAVPFVTSNDLAAAIPNRSTVQQIYDHIIADLNAALPNLPADNSGNRYRGSVAAAYSILARTYLMMRNYTRAAENAQLALDNGPNTMIDYNNGITVANYGIVIKKQDAIYARISLSVGGICYASVNMIRAMGANDLRLSMSYYNVATALAGGSSTAALPVYCYEATTGLFSNWGTGVAEMHLILAEAAARDARLTAALNELDVVRKCRIESYAYVRFTSSDQEAVLQAVLNERVFEMPFNGTRWFDMRRLDAEGRMPAVTRLDGNGAVIATLAPKSPRYTLQIPVQVLYYNPDWPQNP